MQHLLFWLKAALGSALLLSAIGIARLFNLRSLRMLQAARELRRWHHRHAAPRLGQE